MSRKISIIALVLAVAALAVAVVGLVTAPRGAEKQDLDVQYVMYLGTNDKDTYEPYGTPDECKQKVDEILSRHFSGFTIQEASGGWKDESGKISHEYTVVIILSDTFPDKVYAAADDLIAEFNQSSVLIQENRTVTQFYNRKDSNP